MGITYTLEIDLDHDGLFGNANGSIGARLISVSWGLGMPDSLAHISRPIQASVILNDPNLDFSRDLGVSPLGDILHDKMVRLRATVDGQTTRTLLTGWISNIQSSDIAFGTQTVITIEDRMLKLQDAEYLPEFSTNSRVDEEIQKVFDSAVLAYPYLKSHWVMGKSRLGVNTYIFDEKFTDLEIALSTLAFAGDAADRGKGVSAAGYIADVLTSERGGRFFVGRDGKFTFHNRFHDKATSYSDTFTNADYVSFQLVQGEVYNEFTVNYTPRTLGVAGTVLYQARNTPFEIQAQSTKTLRGRFYNPDAENASIGGMDLIEPVAVTDYQASLGGDDNYTALHWNFELGATGVIITIDNPTTDVITVSKLQVRGTPIFTYQQEAVTVIDVDSLYDYGRIPFPPVEAKFINTETEAQSYADYLKARYAQPSQRYESITFYLSSVDDRVDGLSERVLSKSVGDIIRVTNDVTGHDKNYAIVGERHQINGAVHNVTWVLRPTERVIAWILGESTLGENTYITF